MGGIQTVVVGDFYQLPPVTNKWTEDPCKYVFQSDLWDWIVPHKIILSENYRQTETVFITAINELSRGCPTPDTMKYLKQTDDNKEHDISLHSRRLDVHLANIDTLLPEPRELKMYNIEKTTNVSKKMRHNIDVPDTLALKVGCPVMLTVNLSHRLVNGLRGDNEVPQWCLSVSLFSWSEGHSWNLWPQFLSAWPSHPCTCLRVKTNPPAPTLCIDNS